MNNSLSQPRNKSIRIEIVSRMVWVTLMSFFVWKVYGAYIAQPSIPLLLLLVGEVLTVGLLILSRLPVDVNRRPYALLITMAATFYFLFIELSNDQSTQLISAAGAGWLQLSGISLQVMAKAWLGRSFGVLPANRGIVTSGPYRLVRHPIYLGYFLNHIGALLYFFNIWNLVVYSVLYLFQVLRILEEEKLLKTSQEYQDYTTKVRSRFIPLVF